MGVSIPTPNYGFPDGGISARKISKQPLITSARDGIIYLPGGAIGQPVSPSFLSSWDDTTGADRRVGYFAYSLAEKRGQGGGSISALMSLAPTHGGGTQSVAWLYAQHVIEIPKLFTPASSIRGVTRGAFETKSREITIHTDSTYRGCFGVTLGDRTTGYTYVSGAPTPAPYDHPTSSPTIGLLVKVRLVDSTGADVSTIWDSSSAVTVSGSAGSLQGARALPSALISEGGTTPSDRLPAYIVVETGFVLSASGNNFVYMGAGTWYVDSVYTDVQVEFDDSDDDLMSSGESTLRSTYLSLGDVASSLLSDYYQQYQGASR